MPGTSSFPASRGARLLVALTALAVVASACSDDTESDPPPATDDSAPSATTPRPTEDPMPDEPTAALTTDDALPDLVVRVGDETWSLPGIASTWCAPDSCYDADVSTDVSAAIAWDTSTPLSFELPVTAEARAGTRDVDESGGGFQTRPLALAEGSNPLDYTIDSRPPARPMEVFVTLTVAQESPTPVDAVIHYGATIVPAPRTTEEAGTLELEPVLDAAPPLPDGTRACEAGTESALHVTDEPPGRVALAREWTDAAGCLVRVDVLSGYVGAEHCDWTDTEVITTGTPLGERHATAAGTVTYARDPNGSYRVAALVDGFDPDAVLPLEAEPSPFRSGRTELWIGTDAAYLVDGFAVERWPSGEVPLCA